MIQCRRLAVSHRKEALSVRAFQALLALYPAAFRDEYGRELALVFVDRYRDAGGQWERVRLWLEAVIGILAEAPKEHCRMILHDLRYAGRVLRQHMLVTTTIVATLGLGIGANTAVFSVLNAVMLWSLPVADADRLFSVNSGSYVASGLESARLSGPMFDRFRQAAPEGVGVAAMSRGVARVYTRTDDEPGTTPASLQLVSPGFFPVLGVSPMLGQLLPLEHSALSDAPVAVVSHGYWQRRFAGAPNIVGRTLTINGTAFTVIGVGPRDFVGVWLELPVDIWVPLTMQSAVKYSQNFSADGADFTRPWLPQGQISWLYVVVRVPPGQQAAVIGAFNASLPGLTARDTRIVLEPFAHGLSQFRRQFSAPLVALMVMATLVLLITCANVANLLLARAVARQREIAVRMALGAGRARLLHQLLTESALLVVMAGAAAVLFARWAGDLLVRAATATTDGMPPFAAPVDLRVLVFTASLAFMSVLIFGLMPAWRATRLDAIGALRVGARGAIGGALNPAQLLVILQVALSLVLVTGTGLFVRSFLNLLNVDIGVERERLLTVGVDPRLSGRPPHELPEMYRRVLDAVVAVPGVHSASLAMCGVQSSCAREDEFIVEGYQARAGEPIAFRVNAVTADYFSTVGMPLLAGRVLSERDVAKTPKVAVVNRTLATRYFSRWQQAIGRRFGLGTPDIQIVGVVEDARVLSNVKEAAVPSVFVPLSQRPVAPRALEVRTLADPTLASAAVRLAVLSVAPDLPIESIVTMEEHVRRRFSQERLVMLLTCGFGVLALGLAGLGLFGVLAYAVARRTPEIGLRIALGASQSRVLWSVVRDALWLVLFGVCLGLPLVFLGGNLVSTLVFGVSPHDAASLVAASVVLVGVGVACSIIPARRAARVDPVVALSQE
jgi:predicted permease